MNNKVGNMIENWRKGKFSKTEKRAVSAVAIAIALKLTYEFGYAIGEAIYYIAN